MKRRNNILAGPVGASIPNNNNNTRRMLQRLVLSIFIRMFHFFVRATRISFVEAQTEDAIRFQLYVFFNYRVIFLIRAVSSCRLDAGRAFMGGTLTHAAIA